MKMVRRCSTLVLLLLLLSTLAAAQTFGSYLGDKPTLTLEQALPIAIQTARTRVPELDSSFALHSVKFRSLKNDRKGQHWQFLWQEVPFKTHVRGILVRVYMKDRSTWVEEFQE